LIVDGRQFETGKGWLAKLPQGVTYEKAIAQQYNAVELALQAIEARKAQSTTAADAREDEARRMREGAMPVPMPWLSEASGPTTGAEYSVSNKARKMVKFKGSGLIKKTTREYRVEGGKLFVIKSAMIAGKPKISKFDLSDCAHVDGYMLEKKEDGARLRVPFEAGFPARVWIEPGKNWRKGSGFQDSRFYLYCESVEQAEGLVAQIRMAKYMADPSKQNVFRRAVQRIMAQKLSMTVDSVIAGYKTVNEFRSVIKRFIGNLLHADLARGYKKWRMLYMMKQKEKMALEESKAWASRFMTDTLFANRQLQVKTAEDVRQEVVTAMQKAFKRMRRARIMAGDYAFPHGVPSRMERAREGVDAVMSFQGLTRSEVFRIVCDQDWVKNRSVDVDITMAGASHGMSHTTTQTLSGRRVDRHSFMFEYLEAIDKKVEIKPHATMFEGEPAYSDCEVPIDRGMIHFSDNLTMVKFCVGKPTGKEHSQLNKAEHSYFVQTDTISCVIINSEHFNAKADSGAVSTVKTVSQNVLPVPQSADTTTGHWVTICGPRVSFGRKMYNTTPVGLSVENTHKFSKEFGTAQEFSKMPFGFLELSMTVSRANIKTLYPPDDKEIDKKKTKVRFSFLGKTTESVFESTDADGTVGKKGGDGYSTQGVVVVPNFSIEKLGESSQDNEFYDSAHCVFDIIEESPVEKIIGTYECKLSTLVDFMKSKANGSATNGTKTPAVAPGTQSAHVFLSVPDRIQEKPAAQPATIQVTFSSRKADSPKLSNTEAMMPVAPSSVGVGLSSTMYTTQKGAYFDGRKGPGRFSVDHVGNCLEVYIKSFHFHEQHKEGTRYYAVLRCGSSCRTTPAYVRPRWVTPTKPGDKKPAPGEEKAPWSKVHSDLDPKTVTMLHMLFLPLPADMERRDIVEIELRSLYVKEPTAYTYVEAKQVQYAGGKIHVEDTYLGTAWLQLDRLAVGDERSLDNLRVSKDHPIQYEAFTCALIGSAPPEKPPLPFMNITFALRDKDLSKIDERRDVLLVGDGAVLSIEETVVLPVPENMPEYKKDQSLEQRKALEKHCAIKYRKLFAPKLTEAMKAKKNWKEVLPLRPPCLRSELELSGMEGIQNFFFKQRGIPDYCDDPVPYQYIVARNEKDHERRGCQGSYYRVMSDMADRPDRADKIVDSLTHLVRGVNCTVLAIYADRTATVEIQVMRMVEGEWKFINDDLERWAEQKSKLLIPGSMEWRMENGEPRALRLHGVHLTQLRSVECGGFSVYDAKLTGTITKEGNKSNLDATSIKERMMVKTSETTEGMIASGYGVTAGPLPICANPYVATYEWTFNVNLPSEAAMLDFVEALRGAARTSADQVKRQMLESLSRPKVEQVTGRITDGSDKKGNVEIVLMEATRLRAERPVSMLRHPTIQMLQRSLAESTQPLSPVVRMTIKSGDKRLFNPQEAPKIEAEINRARWCAVEQLKIFGGYTLRTPLLDLTKTEHELAHIEFTVANRLVDNVAVPVETTLATASLPVKDLMSCDTPFQQHILKLDGTEKGELYLMTRYAVTRPEALRLDLATANEYLNHKIRIAQEVRSRFKCPPASFQKLYNANLSQHGPAFCRASRDANSATGYSEPTQLEGDPPWEYAAAFKPAAPPLAWEVEHEYKKAMFTSFERDEGYAKATLNKWIELEDKMKDKKEAGLLAAIGQNKEIGRLCEKLFKSGIPDEARIDAWSDITNATKIGKETTAMQFSDLVRSVDTGNNTAAVMQLDEDFHALMAEGRSPFPDTQQVHENNLRRARDVCRALIAFSAKNSAGSGLHLSGFSGSQGIAYCRALLYIAYFLVLLCKHDEEHKVFFIMFALIGHGSNRVFEDYHGLPKHIGLAPADTGLSSQLVPTGPALCSQSAAMADVAFLDTALAVYEPALYTKLSSCGFHCSMFFYKAFMRLYASVLPELTLFRFWDRLFYETTAQGPPSGKSDPKAQTPPQRASLVELAFGAMTQSLDEGGTGLRENLMCCSSSAEVSDCLELGFLIYDVDLVGELIDYGRARMGASVDQVSKTLMEATFAETMNIYHNFSRIFQAQTATISTLLSKPGSIGSERVSVPHLGSVSIHKIVLTKVRDWF
jgi:hypothetical protein